MPLPYAANAGPIRLVPGERRWQNVPTPTTPLIGREEDVASVSALLRHEEIRLVTLIGPGGVGKTRLAIQVAIGHLDDFTHGVCYVSLSQIRQPEQAVAAVARTLEVREERDRELLATVTDALRERHVLLVLNNFEQIIEAAPKVAELLAGCPQVKVLVTSRRPLRIRAEHKFGVLPLAVPDMSRMPEPETVARYPAVDLFVQRAQAANAGFALTEANLRAIADICVRLDGIPLAIELAAARSALLPPRAMLSRLEQRLSLLTNGPRDVPHRHQTLSDAITWSYDLLAPDAQALFRRLAVFVGGCPLSAAAAVAGDGEGGGGSAGAEVNVVAQPRGNSEAPPPRASAPPVLASVGELVDQSLLRQTEQEDGEPRFWMLETIREYALGRLAARGEEAAVRRVHAAWCLALVEEAEPELIGPEQGRWLNRLETELSNLRAALTWALDQGEAGADTALRIASALWRFWVARAYLVEGRGWLERALASGAGSPAARAKALQHLGNLALDLGDYASAGRSYEEDLAARRRLGDQRGIASALNGLGLVAFYTGSYADAKRLHEESMAIRRRLADRQGLGNSLTNLGIVAAAEGDYAGARALHEAALAVRREMGDAGAVAYSYLDLGNVARLQYQPSARELLEQSLTLFEQVGDKLGIGYALHELGHLAHQERDEFRAMSRYAEALRLRQTLGDQRGMVECLEGFAAVAQASGHLGQAARLFGAAAARREVLGAPLPLTERAAHDATLHAIRERLGPACFCAAWSAGQALTLDQAIGDATTLIEAVTAEPIVGSGTANPYGLSEREIEVLRLVAQGLTNPQIAERLYLSPRTVDAHLRRIYPKLGVASRAAAIRLAVERGLG